MPGVVGGRPPERRPGPRSRGPSTASHRASSLRIGCRPLHAARAALSRRRSQEHGFADYLPVGVPIWALVGATLGALASGLLLSGWRLVLPARADMKDGVSEL